MRGLHKNELGMVSITIVGVLMVVITLIVLSFAQIVRREQRQALDKQLSSQAYYAAESGVNAARSFIQSEYIGAGLEVQSKTTCMPSGPGDLYGVLDGNLDSERGASYSCLLINSRPKSLKYDLTTSSTSKVALIDAGDTSNVSSVTLSWTPSTQASPLTGCPAAVSANTLTSSTTWPCNGYGIIRIDLVPILANMTRDTMMRNTYTAFVTPTNNASPTFPTNAYRSIFTQNIAGSDVNQGARPAAYCDTTNCRVKITGLGLTAGQPLGTKYYARVMTLYRNTTLEMSALDASGNKYDLRNSQVLIDATGKANDVLRRIQVRVPLLSSGLYPDYGIQSTDSMCKQLVTFPGYPTSLGC